MRWEKDQEGGQGESGLFKAGILAAAAVVCFVCVYMWDNSKGNQDK